MSEERTPDKQLAMEYFQKAYACQMKGELDEAIAHYKISISICPTPEAYTFLGWTYSFMGRLDAAIEECRKAIELDPGFGNPYNDIGAYLIEKGRLDEAIPWLEKAITAHRYESRCYPHLNLGRIREKKGQWQQALEEYKKSLEANPNYMSAARAYSRLRGMFN